MKLLLIISSLDNGGTENHLLGVIPGLKQEGMDITVMALKPGGYIAGRLRQLSIPVLEPQADGIGTLTTIGLFFYILYHLYRLRPDIVHFYLPRAYLIGGFASLFVPLKQRIMSRRSLNHYQQGKPLAARCERLLHRFMSIITANSRAVMHDLRREGVPESKIKLIYNGVVQVEESGPGASCRQKLMEVGITGEGPLFIYVANLIEYKGHADLIHALGRINGELTAGWHILCVGRDTGYQAYLETLVQNHGISDKVIFTGSRTDVYELLSCAQIAIMASHQEGFSNSLLEKMSAGLPVVATDVGGNAEAIVNGESGLLVPSRDPAAMGKAILVMVNDPALQKAMGDRARERVKSMFGVDTCISEYLRMYSGQVKGI